MKKIATTLLSLLLLLCFVACGGQSNPTEPTPAPTPTPMPEWAELTKAYEAWVEEFLELSDYVIDNPSDVAAYEQFIGSLNEAVDWEARVDGVKAGLADQPEQQAEFINEVNRITQIMNDYAAGLDSE